MKHIWVLLLILFLFASCGETGFLLDDTGEDDFIIDSIEEGSVLKSGDEITVALVYEEGVYNPESLEIVLVDQDEEIVGSTVLSGTDLTDPIPPVSLPEIEPGYYTVRYIVKSGEEVISEEAFPFFYTDEDFSIQGISVYPPVILTGGSCLLQAELQLPESADPFLRWSMDETLICEGFLREGADRIEWQAPENTGVYVISLELYPFGQGYSDFYNFRSTVFHQAKVYVGDKQATAKGDLIPEDCYISLFHLKGSLQDSGTQGDGVELTEIGEPGLDIREGVFGYYLDGLSGFEAGRCLIPAADTAIPFSVTFTFLLEGEQSEREFFSVLKNFGEPVFRLFTDVTGELFLDMSTEAGRAHVPSGLSGAELEYVKELTVSVIPNDTGTLVQWFADGIFIGSTAQPFVFSLEESADYTSIIGGDGGFTGLLDEFGIYVCYEDGKAFPDREVFRRAMKAKHGRNLVLADGLDGFIDSEFYEIEGLYSFSDGALILHAGSSLLIPGINRVNGEYRIVLETDSAEGASPVLYRHPERDNTVVFGFGPVETGIPLYPPEDGAISCTVSRQAGNLLVSFDGIEEPYRIEGEFENLDIVVNNALEDSRVMVHSLLIYSISTQIAEQDETVSASASL